MGDERLHGGIEAVALAQLDRQAFGEVAGAYAGRIEGLQDGQRGLDLRQRRTELVGHLRELAGEIAGLVDQIDEILPDQPAGRIDDRQHELLGQMVGQRPLRRNEGLQIVLAVLLAAGAGCAPVVVAGRRLEARARRRRLGIVGATPPRRPSVRP